MSVLLDALTVLIILATIWLSYRRGFLYTIIGLVGYVLSVLAALALSVPLGAWIYTHLLQNLLLANAKNYIAGQTLSSFTETFGQSVKQFAPGLDLSSLFQQGAGQLAGAAAQAVVQPIGMAIGRGIAFIVLFFLFIAAVHIFENLSLAISHVPILGTLNRIGGALLGFVKAVLVLFVLCTLISALLPALAFSSFPLTSSVIDHTTVFKFFYQLNPFAKIL